MLKNTLLTKNYFNSAGYNNRIIQNDAGLCNGSTSDSDSLCLGSNPSSAAKTVEMEKFQRFFSYKYSFNP